MSWESRKVSGSSTWVSLSQGDGVKLWSYLKAPPEKIASKPMWLSTEFSSIGAARLACPLVPNWT